LSISVTFFIGANIMTISNSHKYKSIEKKYRGHNNKSFKQMTLLEKKQMMLLEKIYKLDKKATILGKIRHITNEFSANCLYHEKNIEELHKKYEHLKIPKDELELLSRAWHFKYILGKSIQRELEELLNFAESNYNDKEK